ncbi:hypothetical protein EG68_03988 [Paragonimus skrjabini miyazakii]|uniref:Uncharacterized protein n=1 Tax=Paragonimus skrjabini miyazakii TaxID=59628 RepID=A0A8S9YS20_9TREM|nr:hypothetical protein EG68_03988 [Paragonimus skrjabini miyazakii]
MFSNVLSVLLPLLYGAIHVFLIRKRRETDLWWSQITTLEKEISYRTEQGLYYSYYKVLVEERNFFEGLRSLFSENRTESPVVINIFKRMNIFPEIVLSVLYRLSRWMSPIDFYDFSTAVLQALTLIGVCFAIQDLQVQQLTSALLYAVLFISNQHEMSRVAFALPLRENFALPFWWLRLFFIIRVVSPRKRQLSLNSVHLVNVVLLITTTVAFCITWQFCQFVLLLEACIIAPLFHIGYLQDKQCLVLCTINVFGLISTSLVQAGSLFPFASPCFALLLTHILWIWFKFWLLSHSGVRNATSKCPPSTSARFRDFVLNQFISKSFYHPLPIFAKCFLFTALSCISKYTVPAEDATHILKFVLQKLNIWHQLDFHATLYLCSGAFQSMNIHSYLTDGLEWSKWVWPSYIFGMVWLSQIGHSRITRRLIKTIKKLRLKSSKNCKRSPTTKCEPGFEVYKIWHFAYNIIFGILAWSTVRMKYLWTPHLLLVSTCGLVLICEQTAAAVMPVLSRLILARQIWSQKQCNDSQKGRKPNKFSSTAYRKRLDLDPFQCIIWRWRLAYILALALTVYFLIHVSLVR